MLDRKQSTWTQYKRSRNQTNSEIKWHLINELSSRHSNKVGNISEIKIAEKIITEPLEIAEELNLHFSTISERLASEIPASDIEPETYLTPTETSFSLTVPSLDVVYKLLSKL